MKIDHSFLSYHVHKHLENQKNRQMVVKTAASDGHKHKTIFGRPLHVTARSNPTMLLCCL